MRESASTLWYFMYDQPLLFPCFSPSFFTAKQTIGLIKHKGIQWCWPRSSFLGQGSKGATSLMKSLKDLAAVQLEESINRWHWNGIAWGICWNYILVFRPYGTEMEPTGMGYYMYLYSNYCIIFDRYIHIVPYGSLLFFSSKVTCHYMPLPSAASASWLQESQVELPQLQLQLAEAERKCQTLLEEMKALREVLFFVPIFQVKKLKPSI